MYIHRADDTSLTSFIHVPLLTAFSKPSSTSSKPSVKPTKIPIKIVPRFTDGVTGGSGSGSSSTLYPGKEKETTAERSAEGVKGNGGDGSLLFAAKKAERVAKQSYASGSAASTSAIPGPTSGSSQQKLSSSIPTNPKPSQPESEIEDQDIIMRSAAPSPAPTASLRRSRRSRSEIRPPVTGLELFERLEDLEKKRKVVGGDVGENGWEFIQVSRGKRSISERRFRTSVETSSINRLCFGTF